MKQQNAKQRPFLTIGIASYNYGSYLEEAFNAIKHQSFKDYEVLYCDDGSTDNSVDIIKKIIDMNPDIRVRLIQGENLGIMGNKNRILQNASGKYLMICDADDKMLDSCLETLCSVAEKTDADQVVGAFVQTDENGKVLQIQDVPPHLSRWIWGAHHATIYKMSVITDNHIMFDENCYPDDMYFNMVFHDNSKSFQFVNIPVYVWNMHSDSTSAVSKKEDKWHGYSMLECCLDYITPISKKYEFDEYQQIEYAAIKMYWLAVLYRYTGKFGEFIHEYKRMRKLMKAHFSKYEKNIYVNSIDGKSIIRKPTARILWCFTLSERFHMSSLLLFMYWCAAKVFKFTI